MPAVLYLEKSNSSLLKKHVFAFVTISLLTAACAAFTYHISSIDITYYIAFGRNYAVLGNNAYQPLKLVATDPIISQVNPFWFNIGAVYGPSAIWIFSLINLMMPPNPVWLLVGLKTLWLILFSVTAYLLYTSARITNLACPISRAFA